MTDAALDAAERAYFFVVFVGGLVIFGARFVWAALLYPLPAAVVTGIIVMLYGLYRWREPSGDIDLRSDEWP